MTIPEVGDTVRWESRTRKTLVGAKVIEYGEIFKVETLPDGKFEYHVAINSGGFAALLENELTVMVEA